MYVSWVMGVFYLGAFALLANRFLVPRIGIGAAVACVIVIHALCIPDGF